MNHVRLISLFLGCLICLPGCGRIVDWGKQAFSQGKDVEQFTDITSQYLRTTQVYTQMETAAIFDALWLSEEVRTAYADTNALRYGKNAEQRNAFLRRQLAANEHYIEFYVLSLYALPLGDPESKWAVSLKIGESVYMPDEIKTVDLEPEYKHFFGKNFTRFKVAYVVKFAAKDNNEQRLITPQTSMISLVFRSLKKESVLKWHIDAQARVLRKMKVKRPTTARNSHLFDVYDEVEVEEVA